MSTPTPNNPDPRKPNPTPGSIPTGKIEPAKPASKPAQPPTGKIEPTPKPASGNPAPKPANPQAQNPAQKPPTGKIEPAPKPAQQQPAPAKKPVRKRSAVRTLGQVLVDLGFIDDAQLDSIEEEARTTDQSIEDVVRGRVLVDEDQLLQAKAELHGLALVNLEEAKPDAAALKIVPQNMAEIGKMIPLKYENDTLTVVMSDPNNLEAIDNLKNMLGIQNVIVALASPAKIEAALKKTYNNVKEESINDIIASLGVDDDMFSGRRETSIDIASVEEMANAAPVRKLVNMILLMGIKDQASDIHFEPFEDEYKVRMRCDGVLYDLVPPPRHLATAISSRVKVMANLDIAERRLPQDGRIELNIGGSTVDMRVSILPTMFGESVVIRVLDKGRVGLDLDKIGMPADILAQFREVIRKPNGITLVTGPTGAGKTTTLYSALAELNLITDKIITTEDPVEYEIDGIVQCPINSDIDFTFAMALRAILRQDPDKILVGEIRDLETAQIAIQAALTGHMVFSTLHTNDAPSTITRLRDMGVEPFLITATVEGIMAQRLVRRVCTQCKKPYDPSRDQLIELNMKPADLKGRKFFFGEGCDRCNNMGYKGRAGLYEFLVVNDDIRDLVSKGASTDQFRHYLRSKGTRSLRDSGIEALYAGHSTVEEVVRETVLEDEA